MSEKLQEFIEVPQEFIREGNQARHSAIALPPFLIRCTKPSRKEFIQISKAVAIGFAVMGFIGYLVKLIHIPM
ncbi:secE/sec61-gamma protein [Russula vinacea]|nr:secE/sec61-gamma protein [Russula vinacea]